MRLFQEHRVRPARSIDGVWRFFPDAGAEPPDESLLNSARPMIVPSVWEMLPGFESWRGTAWIARRIDRPAGRHGRLVFDGVGHLAEVFWNGKPVAKHMDAYTPFEAFLPPDGAGVLAVRVENTFGEHSALQIANDYYSYGGITRPVELQEVPPVFIKSLRATPVRGDKGWQLRVELRLASGDDSPIENFRCRILLDERVLLEENVGATGADWVVDVGARREWSPENPSLYLLRAELETPAGEILDDMADRIGFREVRIDGDRILLNGSPLRLRGFNRHENYAVFGSAIPPQAMAHDLVCCHRNTYAFAGRDFGVFQGVSEEVVSPAILPERATQKNTERFPALRVAMKMARRHRCSSVTDR